MWDGRGFAKPKLLIAVVGEDGKAVKDARITIAFSPEIKEWNDRVKFTKQTDGRWCSQDMPRDEEFTVTVEADGYEPKSEKLELPEGATKELEMKLKTVAPKVKDPSGKTSADKPSDAMKAAKPLTYIGRVTNKVTGKPIAGATVIVRRKNVAPYEQGGIEESTHTTNAAGKYTFTIPPDQVAEQFLVIELDVSHPRLRLADWFRVRR